MESSYQGYVNAFLSIMYELNKVVTEACSRVKNDKTRLMDILIYVQDRLHCVTSEAMDLIAKNIGSHRVEVEGLVTFYAFFSREPKGKVVIRLCDDLVDQFNGLDGITNVITRELNIEVGETSSDGEFSLEFTPCIGMCDQAPAAIINNVIFTNLTEDKILNIIKGLKAKLKPEELVTDYGDGLNSHQLIKSMVNNNIRRSDKVLLDDKVASFNNKGLLKALSLTPKQVLDTIMDSGLRGRGGAGFLTGIKWQSSASFDAKKKYIICNADEGEPGTFKDRVLLTQRAKLLIEGMTIAGYAIGAENGIIYLRAEYRYLHKYLESILKEHHNNNLLGKDILTKQGFNFDIRIQLGAGAYICGEESSLISSCEGGRGEPKNRPPYPTESGYLGYPTVVNNVETLCSAARIMAEGAKWFKSLGTKYSTGTKLISISGDCTNPGVYEVPFGITVNELLKLAGAKNTFAVVVAGPSGEIISKQHFNREIAFEDLATGGAFVIFDDSRELLHIVNYYMQFFVDESCGYCTPCRVGNVFLKKIIEKIRKGQAGHNDIAQIIKLSTTIIQTSRCGLGKTSPNPILSTIKNFSSCYGDLLKDVTDGMQATFSIDDALKESKKIAERGSFIYNLD